MADRVHKLDFTWLFPQIIVLFSASSTLSAEMIHFWFPDLPPGQCSLPEAGSGADG